MPGSKRGKELWRFLRLSLCVVRRFKYIKRQCMSPAWYKDIRAFLLGCHPGPAAAVAVKKEEGLVDLARLEALMGTRSRLALHRLRGLRRIEEMLGSLTSSTSRAKLLGSVSEWMFDRHILDGIGGAGELLVTAVRAQFTTVVKVRHGLFQMFSDVFR